MNLQARAIAVIDDDPRVLESLVNLLASYRYEARGYISAEQFLQAGGPGKSNCIIADVEMGQMSGLGLLEHLKGSDWSDACRETGNAAIAVRWHDVLGLCRTVRVSDDQIR
jgi:FixJ family two-component response regulator